MANDFANEYITLEEIREHYEKAKSESERDDARKSYRKFDSAMAIDKGATYRNLFWKYVHSRDVGNDYIDFDYTISEDKADCIINELKNAGIEKFTFSATWSDALDTAWIIQKHGCRLERVVEINGQHKEFETDKYERIYALLFTIR